MFSPATISSGAIDSKIFFSQCIRVVLKILAPKKNYNFSTLSSFNRRNLDNFVTFSYYQYNRIYPLIDPKMQHNTLRGKFCLFIDIL